ATFAPDNADYAERLREAERRSLEVQASVHTRRGEFEERAGRFDAAARCYEQAVRCRDSFQAALKAAEMFLKIRELKKGLEYGIKAVDLDRQNPKGHLVLAQIFRETKQLIDAKRSLERVLELEPQNKTALGLMREIQK